MIEDFWNLLLIYAILLWNQHVLFEILMTKTSTFSNANKSIE
jgi:hypothetical protein